MHGVQKKTILTRIRH